MRVALGLFGISYLHRNVNWLRNWLVYDIDFRKSVSNYNKYIINHLKNEGYAVDVYASTYDSNHITDLKSQIAQSYNTVKLAMCNYKINTPTNNLSRNIIFSRLCHSILNSKVQYDFVVLTRFDLIFLQKLSDVSIDLTKINVVHETDKLGEYDDNFYIVPGNIFKKFVEATDKYGIGGYDHQSNWHNFGHDDCLSFHYIKPILEESLGKGCINTMISGQYMAGHSPFMNILRGYHDKPDFNDVWTVNWQGTEEQGKNYFKS
jgi:hypothetical protein